MKARRRILWGVRLGLSRVTRRFGSWVEPNDAASLQSRLEHGDTVWRAFKEAGLALVRAGRFTDADRMLERGLGAFPDDPDLLYQYAMAAHNCGRYQVAIARWQRALAATPEIPMCHCGLAANLRETGQPERAQAIIDAALKTFPDDLDVIAEAARIEDARERFERSLALWSRAARSPHPSHDWLQGEAQALLRLGRPIEAASALAAARARFPDDPGLLGVEALLAMEQGDWTRARMLWTALQKRLPDDPAIGGSLLQATAAETAQNRASPARTRDPGAKMRDLAADQHRRRQLMLRFQSLGEGCEFGAVQRHFGAEPPDLLRWSTLEFDGLVAALNARLDQFGERANSDLIVAADGEYLVQDKRWMLAVHTFRFAGQVDGDTVLGETCERIKSTCGAFLAALAAAEQVFVYHCAGLDADQLDRLHHALRAFGPVRLLCVQPAAPTAPTHFQGRAGELIALGADRHVGFVERLGTKGPSGRWDIAYEDWLSICEAIPHRA